MNRHAHEARQRGHYFQVPLCALAFGASDKERLAAIISYGVVKAGEKEWQKLSDVLRREFINALVKPARLPDDFNFQNPRHVVVACGANKTNVNLDSIEITLELHGTLDRFCRAFEQRHGRDPMVRLKSSLVFEARDGGGITPLELSVLAAIFSVVGRKHGPVLVTLDRIRRCVLGYKTQKVMAAEFAQRKDGNQPLTDWILRSILDRLHRRKFYARSTYGLRMTYYRHRMTNNQLRKAIVDMKTFGFAHKLLSRHDDKTMTAAIRNFRDATEDKPPTAPEAGPLGVPSGIIAEDVF